MGPTSGNTGNFRRQDTLTVYTRYKFPCPRIGMLSNGINHTELVYEQWSPNFSTFKGPKNRFQEINSASLCSLARGPVRQPPYSYSVSFSTHRLFKNSSTGCLATVGIDSPPSRRLTKPWHATQREEKLRDITALVTTLAEEDWSHYSRRVCT
jgi:hypothetical protein